MNPDRFSSGTASRNCDLVRISAKVCDVLFGPFHRQLLIEQTPIRPSSVFRLIQHPKSQSGQSVVGNNDDNLLFFGEDLGLEHLIAVTPFEKGATVEIYQNREQFNLGHRLRNVDIQI